MVTVNLDALIPREDFEIKASTKPIKKIESIAIRDITPDSFFFSRCSQARLSKRDE